MKNEKLKMGKKSFLPILHFSLLIFPLLASCQTMQQTPDAVLGDLNSVPLDSGAFAYIFIDVQNARQITNNINFRGMDNSQVQQILDLTQSAVAAFYPPGSPCHFQVVAWGSYPASRANMAFGTNKEWKKIRSPLSKSNYWYSPARNLSVALSPRQAFAASANMDTDPFAAMLPGTAVPEGFNQFRKGAVLSCWFDNPAPAINTKLAEMGLPIEIPADELFISLYPHGDLYEAQIRLQFASEAQARGLTTILAFARGLISSALDGKTEGFAALLSLFFANPPVQDGNTLTLTTAPLSGREIALLFNVFSVQ